MLQMHHQQNSPLVLCDSCPRSYHVLCLELDFHQLPEEGEWACPKCIEKETKQARREGRTVGWVEVHIPALLCNRHQANTSEHCWCIIQCSGAFCIFTLQLGTMIA